ncbi:DUF3265 domain-containing protein [Vibrio cholerae]|nr:DUF3265 domain-containing protein [Vibrio cholerae]EGR5155378.1 DUF3265 domain-containing protein [Vibrio cholerae]EJL6300122.1 DUF3265 domain-containing protein [Vibrio cholerae]
MQAYNKAFKRDSCRVAFLVCGSFGGESGVRKVGLCGTHPLTQRYVHRRIKWTLMIKSNNFCY